MKLNRWLLHLFLFTWLSGTIITVALRASAADPDIEWKKIETEHFTILFDSKHYPLGASYARAAELAFKTTAPVFSIWPRKTTVLIDDGTDLANGYATGVPYPMIAVYPVLPVSQDSIGDYGSWGLELLTHEYTHILTFEPATGWMKPLRWVFGTIIRPNILLPRWYTEGIAVELETRLSNFGRLRSPNYLSIIRSMVEDDSLDRESIARINETSIPDWPGGIRPYLLGALLWDEMIREKGDGIVRDLNLAYSRRVPFLIDGPIEDRFGFGYANLLYRVFDRAYTTANRQLESIRAAGIARKTKLHQTGYFSHTPTISPDGKNLLYIGREHNIDATLNLITREQPGRAFADLDSKMIGTAESVNRVSWLPDSTAFIYNSTALHDRYYRYSDLWRFDLGSKVATQLTHGIRAREAVVSPDGRAILFVQNTAGGTRLVSTRIDGTRMQILYEPEVQIRLSWPEFLNNGRMIFGEKTATGDEVFRVAEYESSNEGDLTLKSQLKTVLADFKPVHFPNQTKNGLIFVSDRSGVANLYLAADNLDSARAITNSTSRVMTGEIDAARGDLVYSALEAAGPQLYSIPSGEWRKTPARPPQISSVVDSKFPAYKTPEVTLEEIGNAKEEAYSPLPYLLPRYWMPYMYVNPDSLFFSASTATNDPTGRHAYSFELSYDTLVKRPSLAFSYTNQTTRFPVTLLANDISDYLYGTGITRRLQSGAIYANTFIPHLSNNWRAGLGAQYDATDAGDSNFIRGGPSLSLQWSNAVQRGLEISPEKGGAFTLRQTKFIKAMGDNEYDQTDFTASWFTSKWLPPRHAISLSTSIFYAPGLQSVLYGRTTRAGNYSTALTQPYVVMRGYSSGAFIGRSLIKSTFEYRFPLIYSYQGSGTLPFFFQRLHGAVFLDALTLDGAAYDSSAKNYYRQDLGTFSLGTGVEMIADATVFYHMPVQFIFGLYYGANPRSNPFGVFPFFGIGM